MEHIINIARENREENLTDRIVSQLNFGRRLSLENGGKFDAVIEQACNIIVTACQNGNPISLEAVEKAEAVLEALREEAKSYRVICTAHAHIDMNWQWGWDETVGIAIDTISTMLKLLEEYPAFKFSLSQASTYKIIADYAPALFEQIKKYVHEGRWEVTAASWVECDKNMPNGESLAMQIIEAKKYLSNALDIPLDSINIDFEPDTFGHSINVPEILQNAGVKYYYHCRGTNEPFCLYRWRSPSGKEVLVNRENNFYSSPVRTDMGLVALEMAKKQGFKTTLRAYGVGDHGGGPSRRDIEMLQKMASWPCFPDFILGTYAEFFAECEKHRDDIPVVECKEINCIFDGCYNTQTAIKTGNKQCESALYQADMMNVLANNHGFAITPIDTACKQKFLLNHFHDIITGSCVASSKAFALGEYQYVLANTKTISKLNARAICDNIDTSILFKDTPPADRAFGAGAGSAQPEFGMGIRRVYHIFNTLPYPQTQVVDIRMWDWYGDRSRLCFTDTAGNPLPHQITSKGFDGYWGHTYVNVLVQVTVPAAGYTTVIGDEGAYDATSASYWPEKRQQTPEQFVLENEYLRVEFNSLNMTIHSAVDKETGKSYFQKPAGVFRYIMEAAHKEISNDWKSEMSSWLIGRYKNVEELHKNCEVSSYYGAVRQGVICEFAFHDSKLKFEVYLDRGSRLLKYKTDITWLENGSNEKGVPQLAFTVPVDSKHFTFDVPFGTIDRAPTDHDLPTNCFAACGDIALFTKNTHGFRCTEDVLSLTVIRGAFDPDPHTELGNHTFEFAIGLGSDPVKERNQYLITPIVITNAPHAGALPTESSALQLDGAELSVAYVSNDKQLFRLYNPNKTATTACLHLESAIKEAYLADFFEMPKNKLTLKDEHTVSLPLAPLEVVTVIITK